MNVVDLLGRSRALCGLAASAAVGLVAGAMMLGDPQSAIVVVISVAGAAASMVTLPTATGRRYNVSVAVAIAAPSLLAADGFAMRLRPAAVAVLLGVVGSHIAPLLRGGRLGRIMWSIMRFGVLSSVHFWVYGWVAAVVWPAVAPDSGRAALIGSPVGAVAWLAAHVAAPSIGDPRAKSLRSRILDRVAEWPPLVTLLATGAFFGVVWQEMPWWWALVVALVPYLFAHLGFSLSARTAGTYRSTIHALSRVPEVAGLTPDGHGGRTAELSLAIAGEIGMPATERAELERAALLHDIGRLTLSQPTILRRGFSDEDVARWGADMIREAPTLQHVADIVAHQHEPYRRPGERLDPNLPLGSKIIRVASAYDHATTELGFLPLEALELLHRGAAYDFDPDVVDATRAVLEQRGAV